MRTAQSGATAATVPQLPVASHAKTVRRPGTTQSAAIAVLIVVCVAPRIGAQDRAPAGSSLAGASVRFNKKSSALLVPVEIAGERCGFVLDTGATCTMLDTKFRTRLGTPIGRTRAHTHDGPIVLERFQAPRATLAGKPLVDLVEVTCSDFSPMRYGTEVEVYGILGMDVLQRQRLRIDFDRGEVTFLDKVPNDAGVGIPLGFSPYGAPTATLFVEGIGNEAFSVDTGNGGIGNIRPDLFTRLIGNGGAISVRSLYSVSARGPATRRSARILKMSLAGFEHHGIVFSEAGMNLLGAGYLKRYLVTFDFPAMRMYLKPGADFASPCRRGLSGASLWAPGGSPTVRSVRQGTAADGAGLRAGDIIEDVNGRPARSSSVSEIAALFLYPGEYQLTVRRGGERLKVLLLLDDPHDPWQHTSLASAPLLFSQSARPGRADKAKGTE